MNETTPRLDGSEGPRLRDAIVLVLLIGLFFSIFLGSRPLSVPDEGRYVEIPREMVVTGDWLTPRLNGVKYFEKPPLFYWVEAFLIKLFGLSEWSVRIGPALFALFGCLAVYYAGARLFGRRAGILSAIVLSTSMLYYALSRLITLDMPVSVLLTAALLCFLLATREQEGVRRRMYLYGFYACAALSVLTKGLIGIVFPAMIIGAWIVVVGDWRMLRTMYLPTGLLLFFVIAAPWHILVSRANPEFPQFYFIHEHFERYLTKTHGRFKPFWFFVPVLIGGLLPWSAFLAQAIKHSIPASWKDRRQHRETLFLLLWAGLVFLFFSKSDSKLIPYILPVFPPLALVLGRYFAIAWDGKHWRGIRAGMTVLLVVDGLFIAALIAAPHFRKEIVLQELRPHLYALSAILFVGALGSWALRRKVTHPNALTVLMACMAFFLVTTSTLMPYIEMRSIKDLAIELKPCLKPGDEVIAYHTYYQDLPVYLERRVTVVEWRGELAFGSKQEDVSSWMIDEREFWRRWDGPKQVFLVTSRNNYATLLHNTGKKFYFVDETHLDLILSNERIHH